MFCFFLPRLFIDINESVKVNEDENEALNEKEKSEQNGYLTNH